MKSRMCFVSNSSSSSFIVIGNDEHDDTKYANIVDDTLLVGIRGSTEFGWEQCRYDNMYDRINFAYLQTQSVKGYNNDDSALEKSNQWIAMLTDALKRKFNVERVEYMIDTWCTNNPKKSEFGEYVEGYIDHASAAYEDRNIEMFESVDNLERFLFCSDSYICGDNDNH